MGSYLNPGSDLFEMALQSQIFVDKSGLIEKTNRCVRTLQRYLCVSRPRRFGKSMAADMLAAYYDKNTKVHQCMIEKMEFPYHYVTVPAVYLFVDNYQCGGDPVFPAWL